MDQFCEICGRNIVTRQAEITHEWINAKLCSLCLENKLIEIEADIQYEQEQAEAEAYAMAEAEDQEAYYEEYYEEGW